MATVAIPTPQSTGGFPYPVYRLTVEQYERMVELGILTGDDRVELLEGWLIKKMPHNPLHDGTVTRIQRRLMKALPDDWLVRVQCAIRLAKSEPEPDLALVPGPEDTYFQRHPVPKEVALIIEVADTSLPRDRDEKGRIYALARIPVYWIVNLGERIVEVYTEPRGGKTPGYRRRLDVGPDEVLPIILGGKETASVAARELLPSLPRGSAGT